MVLGYDEPRPTKGNYKDFLDKLVGRLRSDRLNGLSLMVYGSYVRNDFVPGRSDIDAVLTFPYDVVIPKGLMSLISTCIHYSLDGNNVPFQVCPIDTTTMRDGRFNPFTEDFHNYFQTEGRVLVGPDYRKEMVCLKTKTGEENTLSHNLRKARMALLFVEHDRQDGEQGYRKLLERFNSTLNTASRGSKQILYLVDGRLRKNRFSALAELGHIFPEVDTEPLERIKHLYTHLDELDTLYGNPKEMMRVMNDSVTFFESVIKAYIDR
ncbi:MAG: nucleotidyltransferase domain-containing protein [Candidatus Pacearchaeota archaeon]|jgi:hypothetical protein